MRIITIAAACAVLGFAVAHMALPLAQDVDIEASPVDGQLYTCGMHPEIISNEPGVCPICNMNLTPKRDGRDLDGALRIDPATKQNIGLATARASYQTLSKTTYAFGEVTVPEPENYKVTLKTNGWIERLFVTEEGQPVSKGQPLLEIYSPDLVTAQKELLVATGSSANTAMDRLANAARERLRNWGISEDELSRLTEEAEVTRTMIIRSPADGFVRMKNVVEGDRVSPNSVLYEIASLNTVWIEAQVYEQDLSWIHVGQPAQVSIPALPGRTFSGDVDFVSPWLDDQGQIEVRLTVPNPGLTLKPSMHADVTIEGALDGHRLTIPRSAVINSGARQIVFLEEDDGSFRPHEIVTGTTGSDDMVEIIEGVSDGDAVVVSGQFLLDSETRLSEAVGLGGHGAHGDHSTERYDLSVDESHHPEDHSSSNESEDDPYDIHTCPMPSHYHVLNYGPGQCSECGMDLVPVNETDNSPVYVCPMPQCKVATKEPGNCPVCNMRLIEHDAEHPHDR